MWTTYSPVSRTLCSVSLSRPRPLVTVENTSDGGCAPPALKNEKGARFAVPALDRDDTKAIGRGTTHPVRSAYASAAGMVAGSIDWNAGAGPPLTERPSSGRALAGELPFRLEPGIGVGLVVVRLGVGRDVERMERVEHDRELVRLLGPQGGLRRAGVRSVRDAGRMVREGSDLDAAAAHEIAVHVVQHLVGIHVPVVVRDRDRERMVVVHPRDEGADHEIPSLEALVRG